ncbi:MAG: serine hydrolase [Candidatus Micrarchaeaceae archaeon]
MKRVFLLALVFSFIALPLSGRAAVQTKDMRSKIDQYMNAAAKVEHFMGSVLVARGAQVVNAKGYGMADLKAHVPNTADTEFRIGSVTKQFTAMAILMLQSDGKLNVQDNICKYVPDCPKDWQPITIYNLLTHTSGIPNFTGFPNYMTVQAQPHTPTQLLALFKDKPLDFKPGAKFSYSNSGYVVLGYIIERASGETYKQFLQQHIFGSLGMKNSGYDSSHPTAKNHAKGYEYSHGEYKPAQYVDMSVPFSAGALYSTVQDLYTWDRALAAGKLIPNSLQKQMFTPQVLVGGELSKAVGDQSYYGFGWFISNEFGHKEYSHEGGIQGFTSFNSWFPDQHVYVIVLDNMTSPDVFTVSRSLAAIVFGGKYTIPEVPKAIHLPAKELQKFVGRYQVKPGFLMFVTLADDQLKAQLTGQSAFPIYPESKTRFFFKIVRAEINFATNAKGEVTGFVLHQSGQSIPGKKLKPGEKIKTPKAPKTVSLTPEELQKFVGTYQITSDFSIVITREGDQLKEQATGQAALPLFPKSKTEFYLKAVEAQISFVTDSKGHVTGLVLHQHGRKTPGKKIK